MIPRGVQTALGIMVRAPGLVQDPRDDSCRGLQPPRNNYVPSRLGYDPRDNS